MKFFCPDRNLIFQQVKFATIKVFVRVMPITQLVQVIFAIIPLVAPTFIAPANLRVLWTRFIVFITSPIGNNRSKFRVFITPLCLARTTPTTINQAQRGTYGRALALAILFSGGDCGGELGVLYP